MRQRMYSNTKPNECTLDMLCDMKQSKTGGVELIRRPGKEANMINYQ